MIKTVKTANPVDIALGKRIKMFRLERNMSQEQLGKALGLTFQQVQKYECGSNRVSVSRAFDICSALDISLEQLLRGLTDKNTPQATSFTLDKEVHDVAMAYSKIKNPEIKESLQRMITLVTSYKSK